MAAVWGVDIGKSALKAVKLRRTKEGMEVLAIEHIAYPLGEDEADANEQAADALRQFLAKHKTGGDSIVVGIAGLHAFSRPIKLPQAPRAQLEQVVRLEAQQQIPFPIAEVNWDWLKIEREYAPGEEVDVVLFATRTELVDGFLGDLKQSGLLPDVVTIAPLAIYNFVRHTDVDLSAGGTIILDIGSEHTDLVIADGERFWIRNLRIAGNDITKALAERFKVPFAEAEKLKHSASKSEQSKKIFTAMESVLKDLVGEIHRSVGFFKSQAGDLEVSRLVLLGDGAKLKNMTKYFKEHLGYEVTRVGQLGDRFMLDPEVDLDVLKNHLLGLGVAFGLALQGIGEARCTINLAPQQIQVQAQLRSKWPFAMAAAACSWGALLLSQYHWASARDQLLETVKHTGRVSGYESIQEQAAAAADLGDLPKRGEALTELGAGRTVVLELLNVIEKHLPRGNAAVTDLYKTTPEAFRDPINRQLQAWQQLAAKERPHDAKTFLLDLRIDQKDEAGADGKPTGRTLFRVELRVAKPLTEALQGKAFQVRDQIKAELVQPLVNSLAGAPFFVRDGEQPPRYGEAFVGTLVELFQLSPGATTPGRGERFDCVMVPVRFEVGLPPPRAAEPASAPAGEE